jgi:hypothetical protein
VKASRAYIASLGTSGVLIGSFLLLLAIVSAIFAFRGYPGEASNDGLDRLEVRQTRPAAAVTRATNTRATEGLARTAAADRTAIRRAAHGERAVSQGVGAGGIEGVRSRGGDAGGGGGDAATPGGGDGSGTGTGNGLPALPVAPQGDGGLPQPPSAGDVTGGLGDAVDGATEGLGGTVGRAAPPLQEPVQQVGDAVDGVLEQTAPAVDEVVGGVTGEVGEVTGGLVSGGN